MQLRALLETGADIAYGPWVKGRFVENERPRTEPGEISTAFHVARKQEEGLATKYTKGHEKVEEVLTTDDTDKHGYQKSQQGNAQGTCAGTAFSNPSPSELARDYEKTSPTRCANGPACVLFADHGEIGSPGGNQLADLAGFLKGQSQAGLQRDNQKSPTIRIANDPSAAEEYSLSVPIRDIRGSNFSLPRNFVPEGLVLHALGLPQKQWPGVALLGPRECGKTTLARQIAQELTVP